MLQRNMSSDFEKFLLSDNLFKTCIKDDIKTKNSVFPAIRPNDSMDIYYKGGRLFSFSQNDIKINIKFASVFDTSIDGDISEKDLGKIKPIKEFSQNYKRIKENCSKYSGVEALGVSELYTRHPYTKDGNIVVLDIEVSFKTSSSDKKKKQDRIDILVYNTKLRTLRFYEAKHFSNKELWASRDRKPDVLDQIDRYNKTLKRDEALILNQYQKYINIVKGIFSTNLPPPLKLETETALLVFGFDQNQKSGRLKDLVYNHQQYRGYRVYTIGNISGVKMENLWKETKKIPNQIV